MTDTLFQGNIYRTCESCYQCSSSNCGIAGKYKNARDVKCKFVGACQNNASEQYRFDR